MKKLSLFGLCLLFLTLVSPVRAGGLVDFGNSRLAVAAITVDEPANYYYGGNVTIQLWAKNGNVLPGNINTVTNYTAYQNLAIDGFFIAATVQGYMDGGTAGTFEYDALSIPGLSLHTTQATFALVAWNSYHPVPTLGDKLGVVGFLNPVADPDAIVPTDIPVLSGWDAYGDLVMTLVPEPNVFALVGLGVVGALVFCRRR